MKSKKMKTMLFALLILTAITLVVWAVAPPSSPTVNGKLDPDNEYNEEGGSPPADYDDNNPGIVQHGDFSYCYGRYIPDEGFYICNDWFISPDNYDPNDPNNLCNGANQFDWTDKTGGKPYDYWRIRVLGDGSILVLYRERGDPDWAVQDISEWESATSKETSKNDPNVAHPVWELLIPKSVIAEDIIVGVIDPIHQEPDLECPEEPTEDPNYTWEPNSPPEAISTDSNTPPFEAADFPNWGC